MTARTGAALGVPLAPRRLPLALLLLVDFAAYIPNFPEMRLETRPASMVSPAMMAVYMVAIFLPLAAALLLLAWPRLAGALAIVCGVLDIVPSILDVTRALFPLPPPTAIAVDEVVLVAIGAALCWLGYRRVTLG